MKKFKYDLAIHVPFFKESLRAEIPLVRALFFVAGHYEEEGKSIRALLDEKLGCLGYRCEIRSWGGKPNTAVYATVSVTHTRTKFRKGNLYEVEYKRGYLYNILPLEQAPESKDFGALIKRLSVRRQFLGHPATDIRAAGARMLRDRYSGSRFLARP